MNQLDKIGRREFIQVTSATAAGLILGFGLPVSVDGKPRRTIESLKPNLYIQLDYQGKFTVWSTKTEMGQGIRTLMIMVAAEELDTDHTNIVFRNPSPSKDYQNMITGGSYSSYVIYNHYRQNMANVRQLLINAAASIWHTSPEACTTGEGKVTNTQTGESVPYQNLIRKASTLEVPDSAKLREPVNFKWIGKNQSHFHNQDILNGTAQFGIDAKTEGMVYCSIVRCPVIGGSLIGFDDTTAKSVAGYIKSVPVKGNEITTFPDHVRDGVAVIASSTWAAMKAAENIKVDWNLGAFKNFTTESYKSTLTELAQAEGIEFRNEGQLESKTTDSIQVLEAYYSGPYLSHSPMEPMNATAHVTSTKCEVWIPCHNQSNALAGLKLVTGLPDEAIQIHTTLIGGSFGRRLQVDYAMEAAIVSKQLGQPVKVTWTRIDDTKYGVYRSGYVQKMKGVVKKGAILSFEQHTACASVWSQKEKEMLVDGLDYTVTMPAKILPYSLPHIRMTQSIADFPIPICWWRASYPTIQHTVQECWFDELATAAERDPLELRLELLKNNQQLKFAWQEGWGEDVIDQKRLANVLETVKAKSGWTKRKRKGRGRGVACSVYGGSTYVAEVVEVSVHNNSVKIERVTCAVDCGRVLNPDNVKAQMEGGIIFGLSAALYGEISFTDGKIDQNSYQDYRIMSMRDTPEIDVEIIPSAESVGGAGEPGTHPVMAALCNAIFDATRKRVRDLPVARHFMI